MEKRYQRVNDIVKAAAWPGTHIERQVTQHDCLPSLLGDAEKWIEMLYGDDKSTLYWAD